MAGLCSLDEWEKQRRQLTSGYSRVCRRRAPLLDGRERLAEHVFEREPFVFRSVKRSAFGNLTHEARIAQDIQGLFEAGIFVDIHQNGTAVLRDDDLLFTLLDSRHKFRQAGFDFR